MRLGSDTVGSKQAIFDFPEARGCAFEELKESIMAKGKRVLESQEVTRSRACLMI
jgi:hypothetical protein